MASDYGHRTVVLGIGDMGGTHVRAAQASPWVKRVIGYEPTRERAELRGHELGIPATADLAGILRDPAIRLVTIASPNQTHCDLAIQALRAGKAVLCEKPMGITLAKARQMKKTDQEWSHNIHGQNLRVFELVATGQSPDTPAAAT